MSKTRFAAVLLTAILLPAALPAAEGLELEPGKWEIENTRTTKIGNNTARPMSSTDTRCVAPDETIWSPGEFMDGAPPECEYEDVESKGDRLEWRMRCEAEGSVMDGRAVYQSTGRKVTGKMDMKVTGPMSMRITNEFTGRHVGPCD